jgi:hypothetical protein
MGVRKTSVADHYAVPAPHGAGLPARGRRHSSLMIGELHES